MLADAALGAAAAFAGFTSFATLFGAAADFALAGAFALGFAAALGAAFAFGLAADFASGTAVSGASLCATASGAFAEDRPSSAHRTTRTTPAPRTRYGNISDNWADTFHSPLINFIQHPLHRGILSWQLGAMQDAQSIRAGVPLPDTP